jgi:predicted metal-binding membrane protein
MMMVAMMLPSPLPMLRRYRAAVDSAGPSRLGRLTGVVLDTISRRVAACTASTWVG